MSGQDLISDLQSILKKLDNAVDRLGEDGKRLAEAERDYRIALSKLILRNRDAGMPVTIIGDVCRGDEDVANLKFERDWAQALYDANQEAINVWKKQATIWEAQISREWGRKD